MSAELMRQIRERIQSVGWSETARRASIHRVTLHRMFGTTPRWHIGPRGPKGPAFDVVVRVADAVGLTLRFE